MTPDTDALGVRRGRAANEPAVDAIRTDAERFMEIARTDAKLMTELETLGTPQAVHLDDSSAEGRSA